MRTMLLLLTASGVLTGLVVLRATSVGSTAESQKEGTEKPVAVQAAAQNGPARAEDEAAVRKAAAEFISQVEKGDAKALGALWTDQGEYINEDGTTIRGRAAIEAAYARTFEKIKKLKIDGTIESIRFPSKDTAIEEGYAKSYRGDSDHPVTSRYSVLYAREGGRWLIAVLREWPDEGVSLKDLDWLIGTWEATTADTQVRTIYEWDPKKNSIRCKISINGKDRQLTALQILLKDPQSGDLRSWLFDDDGGFGEATWVQDGKRWVITATGVEADGDEMTATNILTPVDRDTFTWQSTERTLDGAAVPNIPPIRVRRVK